MNTGICEKHSYLRPISNMPHCLFKPKSLFETELKDASLVTVFLSI